MHTDNLSKTAIKHFRFLKKYNYRQISIVEDTWFTKVEYVNLDVGIGIEIILDFRDTVVSVLICKLINNKIFDGYRYNNQDVKYYLVEVLRILKKSDQRVKMVRNFKISKEDFIGDIERKATSLFEIISDENVNSFNDLFNN
ncbi:MAG: hypothetical protein KC646_05730 [Candidatus Cloacimonetes bacterium]|nr:hypothetical protein [Candidatus Cloacimonadota bacterium]